MYCVCLIGQTDERKQRNANQGEDSKRLMANKAVTADVFLLLFHTFAQK